MKKFTQEELEAAYAQMQEQQQALWDEAYHAVKWLHDKLNSLMGRASVTIDSDRHAWGGWYSTVSPFPPPLRLKLIHETYGPYLQDYYNVLDTLPFVTKLPGERPTYEVDTPHGKYGITFEYFDNHCTGY